jgi:CPA2 family monovalent cation:H+ antiporter-2
MHDFPLITTFAAGLTAAVILGTLTNRLGLSPIVGYLFAGVLIGPTTPGYKGDMHAAIQMGEIGVILLMFGVGLKFHLKDLWSVRNVALVGAVVQSAASTLLGIGLFSLFGMSAREGLILGMAMAVASTVVLVRVLMQNRVLETTQGRVAVGWLIVEDIFTVVLLVLVPVLASDKADASIAAALGWAVLKFGVMVFIVLVGGARVVPWILVRVARLRNRELFTLTVLAICLAVATGAAIVFDASVAVGAFLAGMIVAQSPVSEQAGVDILPMRDAFAVLFFVAVGMLFRPAVLIEHPGLVTAALFIVCISKPVAAMLAVAILGHPLRVALTVALGLAQIGEFSFILSDLARKYGLLAETGHNVLVATAIISITLNPLIFRCLPRIEKWITSRPRLQALLNGRFERRIRSTRLAADPSLMSPRSTSALVVGYGPVGASVDRMLRHAGLETTVIDMNIDTVQRLMRAGRRAIYGDASQVEILRQSGVKSATHLVVTLPHSDQRAAVVKAARSQNADLRIFVRARYLRERLSLQQAGVSAAIFEEGEAAIALVRMVLEEVGADESTIARETRRIRTELSDEEEPTTPANRRPSPAPPSDPHSYSSGG